MHIASLAAVAGEFQHEEGVESTTQAVWKEVDFTFAIGKHGWTSVVLELSINFSMQIVADWLHGVAVLPSFE